MQNSKFFNCVDFPVNFRLMWLPGNPAVRLEPGAIIEGPFETLITYNFLRPIQQNSLNNSDLTIQDNAGKYVDVEVQKDVDEQSRLAEKHKKEFSLDEISEDHQEPKEDTSTTEEDYQYVEGWESIKLPIDPKNCNWIKTKNTVLETTAEALGFDLSKLETISGKSKKWELVRFIKAATTR